MFVISILISDLTSPPIVCSSGPNSTAACCCCGPRIRHTDNLDEYLGEAKQFNAAGENNTASAERRINAQPEGTEMMSNRPKRSLDPNAPFAPRHKQESSSSSTSRRGESSEQGQTKRGPSPQPGISRPPPSLQPGHRSRGEPSSSSRHNLHPGSQSSMDGRRSPSEQLGGGSLHGRQPSYGERFW